MIYKRYQALDILRAFSILYVVFIHGAIYNFAGFSGLDLTGLPIYLLVIGAVGLWGGIFVIYSLAVNVISALGKSSDATLSLRTLSYLMLASLVYIFIVGSIQTLFLGRWSIDDSSPQLTVIAELLRGQHIDIHLAKLLDGSGIKMIGLNLLVVPLVLYAIFRRRGLRDDPDNYILLVSLGLIVLLFSFTRLFLYGDWLEALANDNWLGGFIGSLLVADPYPGITYLAYGFFGAAIGLMLWYRRTAYLGKYLLTLGACLVLVGLAAMSMTEAQLFGPSWFWFAKVIAETGVFLLLVSGAALIDIVAKSAKPSKINKWLQLVHRLLEPASRICLTIYLFETTTSELMRHAWFGLAPGWNGSIAACLLFGLSNMVLWLGLAHVWKRWNYKFSVEHGWVKLSAMFGRESTKLAA